MQRFFTLIILCFTLLPTLYPETAIADGQTRIAFVGDFLPAGSADPVIARHGYGRLFDGVRPIISNVDALILNLETPLSARGKAVKGKTYTFRGSPKTAEAMIQEKVKAVWLANNHILDFGVEALYDTMENLDRAGIAHAGAGRNVGQAAAPAVLELGGLKVSLLSFSNTFPDRYWARKNRPGTFFGAPGPVGRAVDRTIQTNGKPVVASFHWGAELMTEPKEYQVNLARLAIENGAALVVGHHPHIPQPIEVYRGVPILYSLGNFSFGSYSRRSRVGLMAVARFEEDGRCSLLEVYPLLVDNYEVNFSPQPITGLEGQRIFDPLVKGIDPGEASALWDGEKGVIVPITPSGRGGDGESGGEN
ncbi:MAG: CapA family protein [bacterium]|nr:CapA family protein [bacterium]MDT8367036.1 CapA family protein [bacterium]